MGTGFGKTAIAMRWAYAKTEHKKRVLVVTTATKAKSGDMEQEADIWNGEQWRNSLSSFSVISWHKLKQWVDRTSDSERRQYVFIFDEVAKAKGYSTGMGRAFQKICASTKDWAGFTATPGDRWIDLMPYMVATHSVKNKTDFLLKYCSVQRYKGYPEIVAYHNEDRLQNIWRGITSIPDVTAAARELPKETHKIVEFEKPANYNKVLKERITEDGVMLDTTMSLCHHLRQMCFTKEKQDWVGDFAERLGTNCVYFCNYIEEEDGLCEILKKALPKGARIWRIDGKHHEIPTAETIGKYDAVVAHYASGGEALNLQFINYWCSVSPNYSYSASVQARGRIKRIGQKRPMFFYYLKAAHTIEDAIYKCLKNKSDFAENVWEATLEKED